MKTKKVGIWIRVSTTMQAQGDSPEHHEARARMYAEVKEWNVVEVYHLEGISGKSVLEHPEARRMLSDIEEGNIDGLIFSKIARLARNTKELLEISEIFEQYNAGLISLDESIDTSSPSGRFFYTLLSAMAQWEREEISARVAASIPIRAKLGKPLGGQAPFGYMYDDNKKLVINEEEATVRRHMCDLFLKHKRKRTVATLLNEQGYTTRKGRFTSTTLTRLLEDPIAKGMRRTNYTTARKGKKEIKSEEHWAYTKAPALLSEEKWDQIQAILKEQKRSYKPTLKTDLHLFTGFAKCSCGGKMYVLSKTMKYICKECKRKITCADLESIFQEQLQDFSISEESIKKVLKDGNKERINKEHLLNKTEKEIAETKKKIESLLKLHETGEIETKNFSHFYKEPKEKLELLEGQFESLSDEILNFEHKTKDTISIFATLKDVYGNWSTLSQQDKRGIIEAMTESIIIDTETVEISLKQLNPSFSKDVTFGARNYMDSWPL